MFQFGKLYHSMFTTGSCILLLTFCSHATLYCLLLFIGLNCTVKRVFVYYMCSDEMMNAGVFAERQTFSVQLLLCMCTCSALGPVRC